MSTLVIKSVPEELHQKIKASAIIHRRSVTQETIVLLEQSLSGSDKADSESKPYFATRKLRVKFQRLESQGRFKPRASDRDITELISEDRA